MARQAMTLNTKALRSSEQARFRFAVVIPAKAGIHFALMQKVKVDSRVRGNDGTQHLVVGSAA